MTLLRDLIEIPDRVHKGDFVLKLTEGVVAPEATLRDYVVTEQLAGAFDRALELIESAVASGASKASYLHGSFGSGKSHFMAVLYLLLRQEPAARAIQELSAVVARHDDWLAGKRFLLVPYHLIGARNLESAILGGYARHLRRLHPEAAPPGVYLADAILEDADRLRASFGDDDRFFARLDQGRGPEGGGGSGWGDLESGWDAESYQRARAQPPESEDRRALVADLLATYFTAYESQAASTGEGFVPMDAGLSELARHAAGLGYHGVVLFLDELILWLASRAGQAGFVEQQIESLVKLVEAERADRPVPIVSFVARQRDLRKLIGDHMPGAERLRYVDKLDHYEGRFGQITLENRNLAKIVEKRLLRPRDDDARARLDEAFRDSLRTRPEVVDTLMASHDRGAFRALYPFSPALVDALVAVSSVLQRERTALKLLSELLVARRDVLEVGDLVPVGDLWDVLVAGDEPFSEEMRVVFEQAKKLWRGKLRPLLEDQHRLDPGAVPAAGHAFHGDARLLKTVLLAALAPEAPELRHLTVSRLVALNHGSIRSPIPGQETQLAATKLHDWVARGAGEIHLGDGTDPSVALELTGVDVDSILERVRGEDNRGNRAKKVRELLFAAMEIADDDELFHTRAVPFKGTRRTLDVVFGNVRELPDDAFDAGERWKLVLDFPFDDEGYTPADDVARLEELRRLREPTRTVCWLPSFLSRKGQGELGRLVLIDFLLTGERFDRNADHLPATDRQSARALLRNQQTQLRERLRQALEVGYGLRDGADPLIDRALGLDQHLQSLEPTFDPRPPAAAGFGKALEELACQALDHQFPAHPGLGPEEVRKADLVKVHKAVVETLEHPDRRLRIEDKRLRELLRRIATPLRLGTMHEAHFELDDHWVSHFEREAARDAADAGDAGGAGDSTGSGADPRITVGRLREWFDRPRPMGLPREIQDLVILLFAERTHRSFTLHGGPPLAPDPGTRLEDALALETQEMPSEEEWKRACDRAGALFGVQPLSNLLGTHNMADLVSKLRQRVAAARPECEALVSALGRRVEELGIGGGARLDAARDALGLLGRLDAAGEPVELLRRLAGFDPTPSIEAVARTLARAGEVRRLLVDDELWQLLDSAWRLDDHRAGDAAELRREVEAVLRHDELAQGAARALRELRARAVSLLAATPSSSATAPPTTAAPSAATPSAAAPPAAPSAASGRAGETAGWPAWADGAGVFDTPEAAGSALDQAREAVERWRRERPGAEGRFELTWTLHLRDDDDDDDDGDGDGDGGDGDG